MDKAKSKNLIVKAEFQKIQKAKSSVTEGEILHQGVDKLGNSCYAIVIRVVLGDNG